MNTPTALYPPLSPPPNGPAPQRASATPGKLHRSIRATCALMLREMSTRYGGSPGGYLWAVLEPIGAIVVIAVALSFIIQVPPLGTSFLLFYASGYLPFLIYNLLQSHIAQSLTYSRPLLMYPAVSWIDAIFARFFLNLLTCIAVTCILLSGILYFTETGTILDLGPLLAAIALMALLGLGHGTLNCLLFGLFPAWAQLWSIVSRPLMVVAGVFFVMEDLPAEVQNLMWWTPWIHATSLFRQGVYATYEPNFVSVIVVLVWALVPLAFGLLLLRRFRQDILMR